MLPGCFLRVWYNSFVNSQQTIVTLSFDDGHPLDKRVVELLDRYSLRGTFYIPIKIKERIKDADLIVVYGNHEVGAHSMTHADLRSLMPAELQWELLEAKRYLERVTNQNIVTMAYPYGYFNSQVIEGVKQAGYLGARGVEPLSLTREFDPFRIQPTIHIYPYPWRRREKNKLHWGKNLLDPWLRHYKGMIKLGLNPFKYYSWLSLTKALFNKALQEKGVFHLWGHSWEIDRFAMWQDFERALAYIAKRRGVEYLTNGEIVFRLLS